MVKTTNSGIKREISRARSNLGVDILLCDGGVDLRGVDGGLGGAMMEEGREGSGQNQPPPADSETAASAGHSLPAQLELLKPAPNGGFKR